MSATVAGSRGRNRRGFTGPRADDPRVVRTRAAALDAARTLFLKKGYNGTTMDEIAEQAGLTKRTLYNNYADKSSLFLEMVSGATSYAESFSESIREEFDRAAASTDCRKSLHDLGRRLAHAIVRPEIVAIRRLLIGEVRDFPTLSVRYFDRAPGQVIVALASGFDHLARAGFLKMKDSRRAAAQFAYLIVGELLDRAVLVGHVPKKAEISVSAREGVETFLARYYIPNKRSRKS